jgi:hypothetical protein
MMERKLGLRIQLRHRQTGWQNWQDILKYLSTVPKTDVRQAICAGCGRGNLYPANSQTPEVKITRINTVEEVKKIVEDLTKITNGTT